MSAERSFEAVRSVIETLNRTPHTPGVERRRAEFRMMDFEVIRGVEALLLAHDGLVSKVDELQDKVLELEAMERAGDA